MLALLRQPGTRGLRHLATDPSAPDRLLVPTRSTPRPRRGATAGTFISLSDSSLRPLTAKMLERPRLLERIRQTIVAPERSLILPFVVTDLERRLAVELGIPSTAPTPSSPVSARRPVAAACSPTSGCRSVGFEGLTSLGDVVEAIDQIRARRPSCRRVIVKLDDSVSGLGNGIVTIGDGGRRPRGRSRWRTRASPATTSTTWSESAARSSKSGSPARTSAVPASSCACARTARSRCSRRTTRFSAGRASRCTSAAGCLLIRSTR